MFEDEFKGIINRGAITKLNFLISLYNKLPGVQKAKELAYLTVSSGTSGVADFPET